MQVLTRMTGDHIAQMLRRFALCSVGISLLGCSPGEANVEETAPEQQLVSDVLCPDANGHRRKADILVVIDDSPSMVSFWPTLAENLDDIGYMLNSDDPPLDYRIAITTTSVPGPGCEIEEPPVFRTDTCRAHLDDFVVDVSHEAPQGGDERALCEDACPLDSITTEPSTIAGHPSLHSRPWFERNDLRESNLPDGISLSDALSCVGLRGGGGCLFESPMEAAMRAIDASFDHDAPEHGFLRDDAIFAILFITDEDDCSVGPGGADIFAEDGDRTFWPDPNATEPQSGICWNAGAHCEPAEDPWLDCVPVMHDTEGHETMDESLAVLQPVERYTQRLLDLEMLKRETLPDMEIVVSVVGGANDSGNLLFIAAEDTEWEEDDAFGIGPACSAGGSPGQPDARFASPALRLHALSESMQGDTFSVCADHYGVALQRLYPVIYDEIQPYCIDGCVADGDPTTPILEHDCTVLELRPGEDEPRLLPECAQQDGEYLFEDDVYVQPNSESHACAVFLSDRADFTDSPYDDLDEVCDDATNLEVKIARRDPVPIDTCYRVHCTASPGACDAGPDPD